MKKKTKKTKPAVEISEPDKDRDLLVTKRLLDLTKQELKGDITSLRLEIKAGFTKVDAKIDDLKLDMSAMQTQMTKMMIMMEDQNDRNLAAHDKNALIYQRLVDNDSRFEKIEEQVFGIKQR